MKICRWIYSGVIPVALTFCVSCSQETQTEPVADSDVLVTMGEETITVPDLEAELLRYKKRGRSVFSKKEMLDRMIEFKSQAQRARSLGLQKDPVVERQIEHILVTALRKKEQPLPDIEIPDEELKKVYDADISKYTRPAADRLAILFLKVEKNASPQKQADVRKRMDEAKTKADQQPVNSGRGSSMQGFAQLSMTYSDDQVSRYRGGDIGWSNRNSPSPRVPEKVWNIGVALKVGGVSDIVETPVGLYLIKKTDSRPESATPFEKVRVSIRKKILAERRMVVEKDFSEACLAWAAPKINEARVKQLSNETAIKTKVAGRATSAMGVPHE
ncbi:MAG: peptidylprolyl isomerase [Kiritimatiellae bacterium]|jgi:peptidyl-prolyl cis-trans isomerase C|nr:peptidylprolyl isomerase [Kiritimatiellia bacterium]